MVMKLIIGTITTLSEAREALGLAFVITMIGIVIGTTILALSIINTLFNLIGGVL